MSKLTYPQIQTLPQFERLIQPIGTVEAEHIRNELINNPEKRRIQVWHGHHLVDQYLFEMCKELNLPVSIDNLPFNDMHNAAMFICSTELKRPYLTDEYKKYLIGQYFHYKLANSIQSTNHGVKYSTASEIAHELSISTGTVLKYSNYSVSMDSIFDQSMVFGQRILLNKIKVSHENVIELSHLKPEEIRSIATATERDNVDHLTLAYIRNEVKWSHIQIKAPESRREKAEKKMAHRPSIHQMPVYDPDSEVNSLCMTIDSWISSIQRVSASKNFKKISLKASLQLMQKLSFLEHTVNSVQETLVERTNDYE